MASTRFTARRPGWVAVIGAALALGGPAAAQPTLRLTADPEGKGVNLLSRPFLRPNVSQPVYLFVTNPGGQKAKVVVRCRAGRKSLGEVGVELAQTPQRIQLPKLAATAPPPAAVPPAAPPPATAAPSLELTEPLEITLLDGKGKELDKKSVPLGILEPWDYLTTPAAGFRSERGLESNRWAVRLQAKPNDFIGPPARAQLVFDPQRIPGLLSPKPEGGVLTNDVTADGPPVELFATNLRFRPGTDSNGLVLLTVDDYRRAFIFNTHFAPNGAPTTRLVRQPGLRLALPRYERPGSLTTPVEVDYPLREPVTVELAVDKSGKGAYRDGKKTFPGARRQQVSLSIPDGNLVFKTAVSDWAATWDTSGITGGRAQFRARLLNARNQPIRFLDRGREVDEVSATVTFLDHGPTGVRLGRLPAEVTQDTPTLTVTAGSSDPPDQIAAVYFFIGTPPPPSGTSVGTAGTKPEERLPEGAVRATRVADRSGAVIWQARLKIPSEKPGTFPVSVRMTNQVGLSASDTARVKVVPPPPPPTTGTIAGQVVKGVGLLGQPGLTVTLWDQNKKQVAETRTDAGGYFAFKDVAPGSYVITSEDAGDKVHGSQAVTVRKGEKVTKDIELSRLGG